MKILIAPDSFKGSLSAQRVAEAVSKGLKLGFPNVETIELPLADGGEGTLDALATASGELVSSKVLVAAGHEKNVNILRYSPTKVALEAAQTVGIEDLKPESPNAMSRHTGPLGQQIKRECERSARDITIGLGGSCTSDGGMGLLCELGLTLLDAGGQTISPEPKNFKRVTELIWKPLKVLTETRFTVMCDVDNPLNGPQGACAIFGPQKGLMAEDIEPLDGEIARLYELLAEKVGRMVTQIPGAGAAGGLGAALLSLGAELKSGAEVLFELLDLDKHLGDADLLITGEGRSDQQTLRGKLPIQLAHRAQKFDCPTLLLSGAIERSAHAELSEHFCGVWSIANGPIPLDEAMAHTSELLEQAGHNIGRMLGLQRQ